MYHSYNLHLDYCIVFCHNSLYPLHLHYLHHSSLLGQTSQTPVRSHSAWPIYSAPYSTSFHLVNQSARQEVMQHISWSQNYPLSTSSFFSYKYFLPAQSCSTPKVQDLTLISLCISSLQSQEGVTASFSSSSTSFQIRSSISSTKMPTHSMGCGIWARSGTFSLPISNLILPMILLYFAVNWRIEES